LAQESKNWIPAYAGMTSKSENWIPALRQRSGQAGAGMTSESENQFPPTRNDEREQEVRSACAGIEPARGDGKPTSGQLRSSKVPIRQIPEGFDVFRPRVAVVDVVRVFPHIAGQQRAVGAGDRRCRVAGADEAEAAVGALHEPSPAGAERADRGLGEFLFEL